MVRRRPSLVGPLILVTAGVLFLLANLGTLPSSFWEIAIKFWPLILILIGLDLIIGRQSLLGSIVVLVLWVGLVGGALWLAYTQAGAGLVGATTVTDQIVQPLGDIKGASIDIQSGLATIAVNALGSDASNLMQGTFRHAQGSQIVKTYDVLGNEGRLALREQGVPWEFWAGGSIRWEIGLNPQVPIALNVNGSVGRVTLDLSGLKVTSLTIDSSVGTVDVTTPKAGVVTMILHGGVGAASVTIPLGMAARIRVNGGLGSINVDQARFPKLGDLNQSADYASATNKIDIEVDGGVGTINIR